MPSQFYRSKLEMSIRSCLLLKMKRPNTLRTKIVHVRTYSRCGGGGKSAHGRSRLAQVRRRWIAAERRRGQATHRAVSSSSDCAPASAAWTNGKTPVASALNLPAKWESARRPEISTLPTTLFEAMRSQDRCTIYSTLLFLCNIQQQYMALPLVSNFDPS